MTLRIVVDLGNSRLKWGRIRDDGTLDVVPLSLDGPDAWAALWSRWNPAGEPSTWWVSTVNPGASRRLGRFLDGCPGASVRWFRSADDVPVRHELETPHTAGTDRALAVLGALAGRGPGETGPGIVISCGSAITVERISAARVWQGGAIGPGLRLSAEALGTLSQLPLVWPERAPAAWGRSTVPALEAGVFWGTVGLIRTLVERQSEGLGSPPWVVWSGGDADLLRGPAALGLPDETYAPSLVLDGLLAVIGA